MEVMEEVKEGKAKERGMTLILLACALFVALFFVFGESKGGGKEERIFEVRGREITVWLADSPAEITKGLGGRESLSEESGLFFIFPESNRHGIWMKGMHFPIDVIWLNKELEVIDMRTHIVPETFPEIFYPALPAHYVLETRAGTVDEIGVQRGDRAIFR